MHGNFEDASYYLNPLNINFHLILFLALEWLMNCSRIMKSGSSIHMLLGERRKIGNDESAQATSLCSQRACDIHERIQLKQNYKQMLGTYKRKCGLKLYYLVTYLCCLQWDRRLRLKSVFANVRVYFHICSPEKLRIQDFSLLDFFIRSLNILITIGFQVIQHIILQCKQHM